VLSANGVLRLCLPDLDKVIDAYKNGWRESFCWCLDWKTISGNFITQITDYNFTLTPLTYEFTEELLKKAGFKNVHRVAYCQTSSKYSDIVELEKLHDRSDESFYVEAFKGSD